MIALLLLGACNSNSPSGSQNQLTNPFLAPNSASQETSDQSPSAVVDESNTLITSAQENATTSVEQENSIDSSEQDNTSSISEQSDTSLNTTPSIGSAIAAENDSATDSVAVDITVTCTSPDPLIQERTLQLVNEARSQPRSCGTESFEATSALQWNPQLSEAADKHSADMAQHNFFNHSGSDGSSVSTRVSDTGYDWRTVGENIAAGQFSADDAVAGWLSSASHCKNLMNPDFKEMAVSCAEDSSSDFTRYWTNVLATEL